MLLSVFDIGTNTRTAKKKPDCQGCTWTPAWGAFVWCLVSGARTVLASTLRPMVSWIDPHWGPDHHSAHSRATLADVQWPGAGGPAGPHQLGAMGRPVFGWKRQVPWTGEIRRQRSNWGHSRKNCQAKWLVFIPRAFLNPAARLELHNRNGGGAYGNLGSRSAAIFDFSLIIVKRFVDTAEVRKDACAPGSETDSPSHPSQSARSSTRHRTPLRSKC